MRMHSLEKYTGKASLLCECAYALSSCCDEQKNKNNLDTDTSVVFLQYVFEDVFLIYSSLLQHNYSWHRDI